MKNLENNIRIKRPNFSEATKYTNSDVIDRFSRTFDTPFDEANSIFMQMKKWLWLANENLFDKALEKFVIDAPIFAIDEMWHNFILHTNEYQSFCFDVYGRYLHHIPEPSKKNKKVSTDESFEERKNKILEEKRIQYNYIYEKLGRETFELWYLEYPKRYPFRTFTLKALE